MHPKKKKEFPVPCSMQSRPGLESSSFNSHAGYQLSSTDTGMGTKKTKLKLQKTDTAKIRQKKKKLNANKIKRNINRTLY